MAVTEQAQPRTRTAAASGGLTRRLEALPMNVRLVAVLLVLLLLALTLTGGA